MSVRPSCSGKLTGHFAGWTMRTGVLSLTQMGLQSALMHFAKGFITIEKNALRGEGVSLRRVVGRPTKSIL